MWEHRDWNQLPDWVKHAANPRNYSIKKPFTKYFKGHHYTYKAYYYLDNSRKPRVKCWRKKRYYRPKYPTRLRQSQPYLPLIVIVILLGAGLYAATTLPLEEMLSSAIPNDTGSLIAEAVLPADVGSIIPEVISNPEPTVDFETAPKSQSFPYYFNNYRKTLSFTTYGGLNDYFATEDHSYRYDPDKEVFLELLQNNYQDEYLDPFIQKIKGLSSSRDEQAKIAISLVQHIPYNWAALSSVSSDFLYPYETVHRNRGVCCDKSILLAYLLDKLGFDAVLFEWPGSHMAVGVRCHERYDYDNTGYAFIETTRPTIITYIPDEYIGGFRISTPPHIIQVNDGGVGLEVSQEYADAQELKRIDAIGSRVLDQNNYNKWLTISNRYDLQYDT